MKMKFQFLAASLLAMLVAGCASNDEPIVFSSEAKMPAAMAERSAVAKGLSKDEERKIDLVVFGYLLERHFWEDGNYTALFVQADDLVVDKLMRKYPDHIPPIKQSYHIDLRNAQSPLDLDTGKPVMILGADVGELNLDDTVDVIGRWYAGSAVQGFYTFSLKRTGDDWPILNVK